MVRASRLLLSFIALTLSCLAALGDDAPAISIETLGSIKKIAAHRISPDGGKAALVVFSRKLNEGPQRLNWGRDLFTSKVAVVDLRTQAVSFIGPQELDASNPAWSPDGKLLAFQVGRDDRARIWLWAVASAEARELGDRVPRFADSEFIWTPDSRGIVTAVVPNGLSNALLKSRATIRTSRPEDDDYPLDSRTPGARVAVYRAGESAPAHSGMKSPKVITGFEADIALIDIGGVVKTLVTGRRPMRYGLLPDGKHLFFAQVGASASDVRHSHEIYLTPLAGGAPKLLVSGISQRSEKMEMSHSPDGRYLSYCESGSAGRLDCYLVEIGNAQRKPFGGELQAALNRNSHYSLGRRPPLWSADGGRLFLLVGDTEDQRLWVVDRRSMAMRSFPPPSGRIFVELISNQGRVMSRPDHSLVLRTRNTSTLEEGFFAFDPNTGSTRELFEEAVRFGDATGVSGDGSTLQYLQQRADAPRQLWVADSRTFERRLAADLNPEVATYSLGKSRVVEWLDRDGNKLQGALLLPAGYQAGKRYPLIVDVYGGERRATDVNTFGFESNNPYVLPYDNRQLFASRGYAVLRADTTASVGSPMADIASSLLPGVNALIQEGVVDAERMGIMGHSYGGYSVLSVLIKTSMFKAAVVASGTANLIQSYSAMSPDGSAGGVSWVEESQGRMGGSLWQQRTRFIENSPLFFFDRISTPILLVHGTEDPSVLVHEADEIFISLRRLGKSVQYAKYLGETHSITGTANSEDYATRLTDWFDEYLQRRSTDAVTPPSDVVH